MLGRVAGQGVSIGRQVFSKGAVCKRRAATTPVEYPAATLLCFVTAERTIDDRRIAFAVVHPAARGGRVSAERAIGQYWTAATPVLDSTVGVSDESAAAQCWAAGGVGHPAASVGAEGAID